MSMTMSYEFITPEIAKALWEFTKSHSGYINRRISWKSVDVYASEILNKNWTEETGDCISLDSNGLIRNGQHRILAIIKANVGIWCWVCRGVATDGIYDFNRKRSATDQLTISRSDFDAVYKTTRYVSVARAIIGHASGNISRKATPKEVIQFTDAHKTDLDKFFLKMPQSTLSKVSVAPVHLALFMAFMGGVDIEKILSFYNILCFGMSTDPEEFPVIAYRNYLKDAQKIQMTEGDLGRCQYALKKYLTKSCTKRTMVPKELIWPFPWETKKTMKGE